MFRVKKSTNKFNAVKSEFMGRWYHSKGECEYAMELEWRRKAGEIKEWIPQFKIDLKVALSMMKFNLFNALKDEIEPGCELILVKHVSKYKPK